MMEELAKGCPMTEEKKGKKAKKRKKKE